MSTIIEGKAVWTVMMLLPKDQTKGRTWACNARASVICETAAGAIAMVLEHHPDARIDAVNRGCKGSEMIIGEEPALSPDAARKE